MKKKIIIGVVIFFIVVGIIGAAGGSKTSTTNNPTSTSGNNQQAQQPTKQEAVMAKIGEPVTDGDLSYTVSGMTTAPSLGSSYTKKDAQGLFYIVSLKIENKGKETKTVDSSMLTLMDSQGRKFDRSIEGQTAKGMEQGKVDLFLQQVQPGLSASGDVVFDAPKDATGLTLVVKGSLFSAGNKIDLGK